MNPVMHAVQMATVMAEVHCVRMGSEVPLRLGSHEMRKLQVLVPVIAVEPECDPKFYCLQARDARVLETGLL